MGVVFMTCKEMKGMLVAWPAWRLVEWPYVVQCIASHVCLYCVAMERADPALLSFGPPAEGAPPVPMAHGAVANEATASASGGRADERDPGWDARYQVVKKGSRRM